MREDDSPVMAVRIAVFMDEFGVICTSRLSQLVMLISTKSRTYL